MDLVVVGLNHETAPIEIRERATLDEQKQRQLLQSLKAGRHISEVASLFTCNRTEIYVLGRCDVCCANELSMTPCMAPCNQANCNVPEYSRRQIFQSLMQFNNLSSLQDLSPYTYQYTGIDTVKHLMKVASGLNSMILGEPQILGQVKQTYHQALQIGSVQQVFKRLFESTFRTAKAVRSQTEIGINPISIPYVVKTISSQFFDSLEDKRILLIGAGEMIQLSTQHLHANGARQLSFSNRTRAKAVALSNRYHGAVIELKHIATTLHEFDLVISCTRSSEPIINRDDLHQASKKRGNRRLLLIDLAVPRDMAVPAQSYRNLYYYDIDHLRDIIDQSKLKRSEAVNSAEMIIDHYSEDFSNWLKLQANLGKIKAINDFANELASRAEQKAIKQLQQGMEPDQVIKQLTQQLTKQWLHPSLQAMRKAIHGNDTHTIQTLESAFETRHSVGNKRLTQPDIAHANKPNN